jgi:hypothetical protein
MHTAFTPACWHSSEDSSVDPPKSLKRFLMRKPLATDASRQILRGYDHRKVTLYASHLPVHDLKTGCALLQAISHTSDRLTQASAPRQPASTRSPSPRATSGLSPVSQPPPSGTSVSYQLIQRCLEPFPFSSHFQATSCRTRTSARRSPSLQIPIQPTSRRSRRSTQAAMTARSPSPSSANLPRWASTLFSYTAFSHRADA